MTICDLIGKLPVHPQKKYETRPLSAILWAVVHHTAGTITQTPEQIARAHVKKDWPGIGYHALVDFQGVVYKCWPATTKSYCVLNGNRPSLCVALIGDFTVHAPPSVQWWAAIELVHEWQQAYPSINAIYGHRECPTSPVQNTECPGRKFNVDHFRNDVASMEES